MRSVVSVAAARKATAIVLAATLCLLVAAAPIASGELLLTYAVTRHGARNVLPKNATLHEGDAAGGPALLPAGHAASRAAGEAFRARYLDPSTCAAAGTCLASSTDSNGTGYGLVGAPGAGFNNYNLLARSSALDRTLSSAYGFLGGVFPGGGGGSSGGSNATTTAAAAAAVPVPVYPVAGSDAGDWLVRAYTKCPAYEQRLKRWFTSPEFAAKSAETQSTRKAVAAASPGTSVALENWWNVYDAFNVWRKSRVGTPQPNISDALFINVTRVADWLETAKMRPELAGAGLGGGLLGDLVARLEAAAARGGGNYFRLLHTSAHYNTQLALLSALGLAAPAVTPSQLPWLSKIPATSSTLVFELHRTAGDAGDGGLAVRLVIQDGPDKPWAVVPLVPCQSGGGKGGGGGGSSDALEGACPLGAFLELAKRNALPDVAAWCAECDNNDMAACVAARARGGGKGGGSGGKGGGAAPAWQTAVTVLVSAAGGAALAAIAFALTPRRRPQAAAAAAGGDFEAGGGAEGRALRLDKTDSASMAPAAAAAASSFPSGGGGGIGAQQHMLKH